MPVFLQPSRPDREIWNAKGSDSKSIAVPDGSISSFGASSPDCSGWPESGRSGWNPEEWLSFMFGNSS